MRKVRYDFDLAKLETIYGFKYKDLGHWQGYVYKDNVICVELESREIEVNIKNMNDLEKVKELYDDSVIASRDNLIYEWAKTHHYIYSSKTKKIRNGKKYITKELKCFLKFDEIVEINYIDDYFEQYRKEMKELEQDLKDLKEFLEE